MKKLEDIPKKNAFEVPDGYFDRLPGVIQRRVTKENASRAGVSSWNFSLRYALPAVVLMIVAIFWLRIRSTEPLNIGSQLAMIEPAQLGLYLEDHELSTEDLLEETSWSSRDVRDLENAVYSNYPTDGLEIKKVLDEYNVEL